MGAFCVALAGAPPALGAGGTAKPPTGGVAPFVTPTLADPAFSVDPATIHGFDDTGFVQDARVSGDNAQCPDVADPDRWGGTLRLNGATVIVPCNLVIQMPANTFRWADFVHSGPSLALPDLGSGHPSPSFEMRVVGNLVGTDRLAALIFASQQATNTQSGVITGLDYARGSMQVDTETGPTVVAINDPKVAGLGTGRFSAGQSPDERFSVDQGNATVHAATGYPMCIPRVDPTSGEDPLCPQANRPKVTDGCRNFSQAGVPLPASGELGRPAAGQEYCSQFVMPPAATGQTTGGGPDPRQQAPFEVGDFVTYAGTLVHDSSGDYLSAHTVEANLGIYTQPGTQPGYLAIGEFGIGSADPNATAVSGVAQETQDRIFLETETTDVQTPVDIYLMDVDPQTGVVRNRWVTPFEMTGENQLGTPSGGITTQFTGPQPQRARLRATKAPAGLLSQPTRTLRVVARSLCSPQATAQQAALDTCLEHAPTVANGLVAGQYVAPVFEFIFPEGVKPGDGLVPFDFWHLPFLRFGEGAATASGVGPLEPSPWGPTSTPTVTLSQSPVDLGPADMGGAPVTAAVTVTNNGPGPLTVSGATVSGPDAAGSTDFTVNTAPCVTILSVGATCSMTVSFAPSALGARSATLQVADDGLGGPQSLDLTGEGVPPPSPEATVSPASLGFGAQPVGTSGAAQTVSVTNTGTAPLTVFSAAASGADFALVTNGCGSPVAPGDTCTITVAFAPTAAGPLTGALTLRSNAPNSAAVVPLDGSGVVVAAPGIGVLLTPPPAPLVAPLAPVLTRPTAPRIATAAPGRTTDRVVSATARWRPPVADGGSPITAFRVTAIRSTGARRTVVVAASARSRTISGLVRGGVYRFSIVAVNRVGASTASALSNRVVAR